MNMNRQGDGSFACQSRPLSREVTVLNYRVIVES